METINKKVNSLTIFQQFYVFKLVSTWCDLRWPQLLPPYALASIRYDFSRHCGVICLQILRATFFAISKWPSSLHEAIAPKRLELQICGCARIEDNSKLFTNLM